VRWEIVNRKPAIDTLQDHEIVFLSGKDLSDFDTDSRNVIGVRQLPGTTDERGRPIVIYQTGDQLRVSAGGPSVLEFVVRTNDAIHAVDAKDLIDT